MPECAQCGKKFDTQQALNNHSPTHQSGRSGGDVEITGTHIAVGALLLLLVGGGWAAFSGGNGSPTGAATAATGSVPFDNSDDPVLGSADAPVTIAYFGDYACPSCRAFEQRSFPSLKRQIVDTGKATFVKKNFPVITRQSPRLAEASQAVWNQVRDSNPQLFWEWHAHMYRNQGHEGRWATKKRVLELTGQVDGIDVSQVREALNQGTYSAEVDGDMSEGRQAGIRGTPTFIIYNPDTGESRKIVGPQPVAQFESVIRQVR